MIKRFGALLLFGGMLIYSYVDQQNELMQIRLKLPKIAAEAKAISEKNAQMSYRIEQFESPANLMALAKEYPHLSYPCFTDVVTVKEGIALGGEKEKESLTKTPASVSLAEIK